MFRSLVPRLQDPETTLPLSCPAAISNKPGLEVGASRPDLEPFLVLQVGAGWQLRHSGPRPLREGVPGAQGRAPRLRPVL